MNKKFTAILLCAAVLASVFSSCAASGSLPADASQDSAQTVSAAGVSTAAEALGIDSGKYQDIESKADLNTQNKITLNGSSASVSGTGASVNGADITISAPGTYLVTGTLDDGQLTVNCTQDENVYVVLNGAHITCKDSAAIYVQQAKNTYVIALSGTENILEDGSSYSGLDENDEPDAALFSKDDLIVGGGGKLTVQANYKDGIKSKDDLVISGTDLEISAADDGIVGKDSVAVVKADSLRITAQSDGIKSSNDTDAEKGNIGIFSGNFTIDAQTDGIQAENSLYIENGDFSIITGGGSGNASTKTEAWGQWGGAQTASGETASGKGLKAASVLSISNGTFSIDSSDDAVHSNDTVNIKDGAFSISAGDDGIHADTALHIQGGTIDISKCYEGLEAVELTIDGGTVTLISSDDGLNAAGGSDGSSIGGRPGENSFSSSSNANITINDGYIYIDADGDGIDSNGSIAVNGGTVVVNGPADGGNGALDYENSCSINGGVLVAAGMSAMAQCPGEDSEQNSVMVNLDAGQEAGTLFTITDEENNVILAFIPSKSYNSVVFSSPDLQTNRTYTVCTGGTASGDAENGLYSNASCSGTEEADSFTVNAVVTTLGNAGMGSPGGNMQGDKHGRGEEQMGEPPQGR